MTGEDVRNRREPTGWALLVAAAGAAVQGAGLLALAVAQLAAVSSDRIAIGVAPALFFVVTAAGLAGCAWGLVARRSWSRGPLLVAQLLLLAGAWTYRQAYPTVALGVGVAAVVTLVLLLHPATTRALAETSPPGER